MFTTGVREFKEINEKTSSAVNKTLIMNKKTMVQYYWKANQ